MCARACLAAQALRANGFECGFGCKVCQPEKDRDREARTTSPTLRDQEGGPSPAAHTDGLKKYT